MYEKKKLIGRPVPLWACLATIAVSGFSLSLAQDVCDDPPGGDAQTFQTSVWGGLLSGDPFDCGTTATPTPLTCALYNRVYTDQESS